MKNRIKELTNIEITNEQEELYERFYSLVVQENAKYNLTAITEREDFIVKHISDSLLIVPLISEEKKIIDIGTGAGVPGIILAIFFKDIEFTLLDSNNKKTKFIQMFCEENNIKNVKTITGRAEEQEGEWDLVISRATAHLSILLEITTRLIRLGGKQIFYKGISLEEELNEKTSSEIPNLGLKFEKIDWFELGETKRSFITYSKYKNVKKGFPRLYKDIKKEPF